MTDFIKICKKHYKQLPDNEKSGNYELVKRNYYCEQCKPFIIVKQRKYSLNYYHENKEKINKNLKKIAYNAKRAKKTDYKCAKNYAKKNRVFLNLVERGRRRGLKLSIKKLIVDKNYYNESIKKIEQIKIVAKLTKREMQK